MDRDDTLRRAEKLLRQGRLDAAIAEYARLVEDNPEDWAAANALGDLYVRAGQTEQAAPHYTRVAEHFAREGFISKATALYKKIVKIRPDDDAALLRAAELSASQGLTAEARFHLQALFQRRLRRGDRAGAAHAARFHAEVDPDDAAGRIESARMLAELDDAAGAAAHLRAAGQTLQEAGKTEMATRTWREAIRLNPDDDVASALLIAALIDAGDPDGARDVARSAAHWRSVADGLTRAGREGDAFDALERALQADPADVAARVHLARSAMARDDAPRARELLAPISDSPDATVQFALAEIEFRAGAIERGRVALQRCLTSRSDVAELGIGLACAIGPGAPEAGFAIVSSIVQFAESSGETDLALDAIERFLAAVPGHISALKELIRVCDPGFYAQQRYRAQVQLADVCLARERWQEARDLAEELVAARPDDAGHVGRLARALEGLGVTDSEAAARRHARRAADAESMTGFGDVAPPPIVFAGDFSSADLAAPPVSWAVPSERPSPALLVPPVPVKAAAARAASPDGGEATSVDFDTDTGAGRGTSGPDAPDRDVFEIDLSGELDDLLAQSGAGSSRPIEPVPAEPEGPHGLDGYFEGLREQRGRDLETVGAGLAYDRASEHFNRGEVDAAAACLRTAARDPLFRFRAASMLARIARDRHRLSEAAEWLERASEAPAPSVEATHGLLYELGDILESAGERARALAVFIELQSGAPGYRNVGARIASLSLRQGGPNESGRGLL